MKPSEPTKADKDNADRIVTMMSGGDLQWKHRVVSKALAEARADGIEKTKEKCMDLASLYDTSACEAIRALTQEEIMGKQQ